MGRVDIWNSWKALGGAMGGYTTAKKELLNCYVNVLDLIYFQIQRPAVGATLKFWIWKRHHLRDKLEWNTKYFKAGMKKAGFDIVDGDSLFQ
jgi:glycine C-acetyltransferase